MPTVAEHSTNDPLNFTLTERLVSWTDDLPVCSYSSVGSAPNLVYNADGISKTFHEFQDRSFHFCIDENTFFYGVFDGHNGCRAVDFTCQRIPAEILLGQLKDKRTDLEVKDVLQQAFINVETSFFQSLDNMLAEKENLDLKIGSQGFQTEEVEDIEAVQRLKDVELEISCEAAAVVALIKNNCLYVANVGNCRAVLCKECAPGTKSVMQLTADHEFSNEDEILRLSNLGIPHEVLLCASKESKYPNTRCIGNYTLKGGYKHSKFSQAVEEPVIADPEVVGGIRIDESCKFLFIMSSGLCRAVKEATDTDDPNLMIAEMISEEFSKHLTLKEVAQAVVDKITQIHEDASMRSPEAKHKVREDITLMIRNFNILISHCPANLHDVEEKVQIGTVHTLEAKPFMDTLSGVSSIENSSNSAKNAHDNNNNRDTISTSSGTMGSKRLFQTTNHVSLDDEGRIKPYVDFNEFYELVEQAYQEKIVPEDWRKQNDQ